MFDPWGVPLKYLEKSFSIYVSDRHAVKVGGSGLVEAVMSRPAPRQVHEFVSMGGICMECMLDKIGHDNRHEPDVQGNP